MNRPILLPDDEVPLLAYTSQFWYLHLRICEGYLPEREIRLVKDFIKCQKGRSLLQQNYDENYVYADRRCRSSKRNLSPERIHVRGKAREHIASPLYYAARLGLVDVVTALLEETDRNRMSLQTLASSQPMHQKSTPGTFGEELRIACFYGRKGIVEILLNAGADVEAPGGGLTTAIGACMESGTPKLGIIQMLLESVETVHPDVDDTVGWVTRWAAMEGHLPVVSHVMSKIDSARLQTYQWTRDYLQPSRSSERRITSEGHGSYRRHGTAPYEAAFAGHHEILSLLIDNWSDIDELDSEGRTSLYWAAFKGHTETVRLLLQNGASTRGHSQVHEWTPAYWASWRGFREIEELLGSPDRETLRLESTLG